MSATGNLEPHGGRPMSPPARRERLRCWQKIGCAGLNFRKGIPNVGNSVFAQPRAWRLGRRDAVAEDGRVVGVWWCFGPVAICHDYE